MTLAADLQGVLVYIGPGALVVGGGIVWRAAARRRAREQLRLAAAKEPFSRSDVDRLPKDDAL